MMRVMTIASAVLGLSFLAPGGPLDRPLPGPLALPPAQGTIPAAGSSVLSGAVMTDATTPQPVRRATVKLSGGGSSARVVGTDDQGRFTFAALPAASYSVSASKPGFVTVFHGEKRPGRGPGIPVAVADGQRVAVSLTMHAGAVIAGTITDARGSPMSSVPVLAVEVRPNGARTAPARATTDDRGAYRIFGLAPGDYLVSAAPSFGILRNAMAPDTIGVSDDEVQWAKAQSTSSTLGAAAGTPLPEPGRPVTYAPVYFPGTTDPAAASKIAVTIGEERTGVSLSTRIVSTAKISGTLIDHNGQPITAGSVTIHPRWSEQASVTDALVASAALVMPRTTMNSPEFSIGSVPPGDYTLVARSGFSGRGAAAAAAMVAADPTLWNVTDVTVDGRDQANLVLRLQPGTRISGSIAFERSALTPPADLSKIDLTMAAARSLVGAPAAPRAIVDPAGIFRFVSVVPGAYTLKAMPPAGTSWVLKSAVLNGRDLADVPIDVKPGQDLNGLVITYTDRAAEIAGTLVDAGGRPVTRYSIIVMTVDKSLWLPNARRIRLAAPATNGSFSVDGLPAGEYAIAAVEDVEASDLNDSAFLEQVLAASVKIAVAEGEKKTQNLRTR
jgi:hypothetical protein